MRFIYTLLPLILTADIDLHPAQSILMRYRKGCLLHAECTRPSLTRSPETTPAGVYGSK